MAEANELNCHELKGTRVLWEIKDFLSLALKHDLVVKRPFIMANQTLEIRLYPNGYLKVGHVSLYVENMTKTYTSPSVLVATLLRVDDSVVLECKVKESLNDTGVWEFPGFISESKLLGYLSSSPHTSVKFVFSFCDLQSPTYEEIIAAQPECTSDSIKSLNEDIQNLYINKELCDVKIKVGPEDFLAHRAILAARSPVFSSMFKHEMIEKIDGVVEITDCDSDSFEDFLMFLYTGKVENAETNNLCLYRIADKYSLNDLKKECAVRMSKKLEVESICDVLDLASVYNETELLENATTFFIKNAEYIFATEKWSKFVVEKTLLSSEILIKMAKGTQVKEGK